MIIIVSWTFEVARDEIQRWRLQRGVQVHGQNIFGQDGSNPPARVEPPLKNSWTFEMYKMQLFDEDAAFQMRRL